MLSPRAAYLGARGVFWAFAGLVIAHVGLILFVLALGPGQDDPSVIISRRFTIGLGLVLGLAAVLVGGGALLLAWHAWVGNQPLAQIGGFSLLVLYSLMVISEDASRGHVVYVVSLWLVAATGTTLARRAGPPGAY